MTEQFKVYKTGTRFYYPVNSVQFLEIVGLMYDVICTVPEYVAGRAPSKLVFERWCLRTFYAYIHMNNFNRYQTSPFLINWDARITPSKMKKGIFSGSFPTELINIIRELARPMTYNNNLYFPNPDYTNAMLDIPVGTPLRRNDLVAGNVIGSLRIPWQSNVHNVCSTWCTLAGMPMSQIGLESLEAAPLSYRDGGYDLYVNDNVEKRSQAVILLSPCSSAAADDVNWNDLIWLVQDLTHAVLQPTDLSFMLRTLGPVTNVFDDRSWLVSCWESSLSANLELYHFPSLGPKPVEKITNLGLGNRPKRQNRQKKDERVTPPSSDPSDGQDNNN